MRPCHGILFVNGMHARLTVWFALALVLARVQCAGFCAFEQRHSAGAPPCHGNPSDSGREVPAPCPHCFVALQAAPPAALLTATTLACGSVNAPSPAKLPYVSGERARNLAAASPPGLVSLSSVILRV